MSFTDDDLKRLKKIVKQDENEQEVDFAEVLDILPGLIARLEAAELLAECLSNHEDLDPVEVTEIGKWQKAAGK